MRVHRRGVPRAPRSGAAQFTRRAGRKLDRGRGRPHARPAARHAADASAARSSCACSRTCCAKAAACARRRNACIRTRSRSAQCHGWLGAAPAAAPSASRSSSNAEAAQRAAKEAGAAAIAGEIAAERYGLKVLAARDRGRRRTTRTRFLVLGAQDAAPTGRDRTSLVMSAHEQARRGARRCSRRSPSTACQHDAHRVAPARAPAQWEYFFFVDIEGHQQDAARRARRWPSCARRAPFLKVLGSYPAAVPEGAAMRSRASSRPPTCARSRPTSRASRSRSSRARWGWTRRASSSSPRTRIRSASAPRTRAAIERSSPTSRAIRTATASS